MNDVKPKYRCPECQRPGLTCPDHCDDCGYVKKLRWLCHQMGYWGCDTCMVNVEDFYHGTLPLQSQEAAQRAYAANLSARAANEDIYGPTPVDSGAWICWMLIGMILGLLAGGVLAVWYLK